MNDELVQKIMDYVEAHIGEFHQKRINKLKKLNLKVLLRRKNPYMYKAENITRASEMVERLANAFMASAEETIFGNWLEDLARFVAKEVYHGYKSTAEGIDLEFDNDGVHYIISIKSGPSWSNHSSLTKLKQDFVKATRTYNTSRTPVPTKCIEGCCYGHDNKSYTDSLHEKYCGEKFWHLISGEPTLYVDIIEPLGHMAREKNEEYYREYSFMLNKFEREFINGYCKEDGSIDWEKLVHYNSGIREGE